MNRELWVMRHAKAQRFDGIEDYDRPLKRKGKAAANSIARWLDENGLKPDVIISSPAIRALATAKIVSLGLELDETKIIQDKRLYDEGLVRAKSVLADSAGEFNRVLLVGHNPELEDLLHYLVPSQQLPSTGKLLPTAGLVGLEMPEDWQNLPLHCAKLLSAIYPKKLESK